MQIPLAILLFSATAFFSCSSPKTRAVQEKVRATSVVKNDAPLVTLASVQQGVFEMEILSNGKAMAFRNSEIKFPFAGKVKKILVENGDQISADRTVAVMDDEDLRRSLARSKELLDRTVIELDDRLIDYGYRLKDSAKTPKDILKMAKMKSGYNSARFEHAESLRNLGRTFIRTPFSGKVANLEAEESSYADPGRILCSIIDDHLMRVEFKVLESEYRLISKGFKMTVIPFGTDIRLVGEVSHINPTIESSGMIKVTGLVKNDRAALINGMAVRVVISKRLDQTLFVPKEAIVQRQDREVVFTYKNGRAIWNYVETGSENSEFKTITSGLLKGDVVILSNNTELANNSPVRTERTR